MNMPSEQALIERLRAAPSGLPTSDKWTCESIVSVRRWGSSLFSFRTTRNPDFRFVPGQFARIGLQKEDGDIVWRAYSIASAAYAPRLEFFSVTIADGEFTSRLCRLRPGDRLLVDKASYGNLTTDRFTGGSDLWLLASGTGLGPFLSILREPAIWDRYRHLVVAHSVRQVSDLAYRHEIEALEDDLLLVGRRAKLHYLPIVTRETWTAGLDARLTTLLADGRLEAAAGLPLDPERSRLMICGNPELCRDLRGQLKDRGFSVARRLSPGQLAFENYW